MIGGGLHHFASIINRMHFQSEYQVIIVVCCSSSLLLTIVTSHCNRWRLSILTLNMPTSFKCYSFWSIPIRYFWIIRIYRIFDSVAVVPHAILFHIGDCFYSLGQIMVARPMEVMFEWHVVRYRAFIIMLLINTIVHICGFELLVWLFVVYLILIHLN